jgi:hypothetical protein
MISSRNVIGDVECPARVIWAYRHGNAGGSSRPYSLKIMSWTSLTMLSLVLIYQGWTY